MRACVCSVQCREGVCTCTTDSTVSQRGTGQASQKKQKRKEGIQREQWASPNSNACRLWRMFSPRSLFQLETLDQLCSKSTIPRSHGSRQIVLCDSLLCRRPVPEQQSETRQASGRFRLHRDPDFSSESSRFSGGAKGKERRGGRPQLLGSAFQPTTSKTAKKAP